jgi:pimeloyl-ACP methyl ester carboxylesterase
MLAAEAQSKDLCETEPRRIHVATRWGTECIAFFVTRGHERDRRAVVFLDGDMSPERIADEPAAVRSLASVRDLLQRWADRLGVRYVLVSRVGLNGSSGNHGERRKPKETMIMNAAVDILKDRLGLDRVVLAGQSGGSTIAATLVSLGRRDVDCAVLGSGAYELVELRARDLARAGMTATKEDLLNVTLDPMDLAGAVPKDGKRRIFVLGDKADVRTPFAQQKRYTERLAGLGHHARTIAVDAQGDLGHGATVYTIPTAGACLKGIADARLAAANRRLAAKLAATQEAVAPRSGAIALITSAIRSADEAGAFVEY